MPSVLRPAQVRSDAGHPPAQTPSKRSVKHLTCFWWKEKGTCKYSEEECLYAHHDTGKYTDPPRQVIPGEPAKAGRSLDRALRNLSIEGPKKPSAALPSVMGSARPGTPASDHETATSPPSPVKIEDDTIQLRADSAFLRTLVRQATQEKAVMLTSIESLQAEKKELQTSVDTLRAECQQLVHERDALRKLLLQFQQSGAPTRPASNPFGVIGGHRLRTKPGRISSSTSTSDSDSTLGSDFEMQDVEVQNMFRHLGLSLVSDTLH